MFVRPVNGQRESKRYADSINMAFLRNFGPVSVELSATKPDDIVALAQLNTDY